MSDDEYRNGFGDGAAPVEAPAEEPVKTAEEIAAEEAKAEEEFISTPEDHVDNPLVPEEKTDDEDEDRLKGAIGSGNLAVDYPEEKSEAPAGETVVPAEEAAPAEEAITPAAEEAPASEPVANEEPVVASTAAPVAEATATVADIAAAPIEPKKKSKAGLIITLVVIFLLLIGGGVAFFIWMMSNESPENILKDSLAKLWTAENVQMTGTMSSESNGSKYEVSFDGAKSDGNIGGSGKIKAKYNGADIDIDFSASYIKGGEAYFKLEGLNKLTKLFESDDDDSSASSLMGNYSTLLSSLLGSIVKKVDGQWYKITAADAKKNESTKSLGCMLEKLDSATDKDTMKKAADAYKKYPFVKVDKDTSVKEEDGVKYLAVIVDKDESKKFAEEVKKIDAYKSIAECSDSGTKTEKDESVNDTKLTLGIKPWSHELVSVKASSEENKTSLDMKIVYDKKDISAPDDAKSIDKLGEDIEDALKSALNAYADKYCQSFSAYGQTYVDYCKQAMQKQMGSFDPSQLFGNFLGGGSDDEIES